MNDLNKKQKEAYELIIKFFNNNEYFFYLFGCAGSGKTFLISKIIKYIIDNNIFKKIIICAPTHKALKVLESFINFNIINNTNNKIIIKFLTIHKYLGFKPKININTGSKYFSSYDNINNNITYDTIVIIDECSMLSKDMVINIKKIINLTNKIIFIGDKSQLPPVGEYESLIFNNIPEEYEYKIYLDEIMRTNNNEIINICNIIKYWNKKDSLLKLCLPYHNIGEKKFNFYHKKENYLESTWFKHFFKNFSENNFSIILTWKNITSEKYNNIIRKEIHKKENIENYLIDDIIIFNNYYMNKDNIKFYTSDVVKITNINTKNFKIFDKNKFLIKNITNVNDNLFNLFINKISKMKNNFLIDKLEIIKYPFNDNNKYYIDVINKKDLDEYKKIIKNIEEHIDFFYQKNKNKSITKLLWDIYYNIFVEPFAKISFGYSLTIYKSQGSTYYNVFVDFNDVIDILNEDEIKKALYTAATRASNKLSFIV